MPYSSGDGAVAVFDYLSQILRSTKWAAEIRERLSAKVDERGPDDCWEWTGRRRGHYGAVSLGGHAEEAAHRLAFAFASGHSPWPLRVCHTCDNPVCCNPRHLFLGTAADNAADMMAKGRHRPSPQPGEKNPRARLTLNQVEAIRRRIRAGHETNKQIASDFGVSHAAVSLIRRGKSWGGSELQPAYESLRVSPYSR